jgi:hypothetical protein
LKSNLKVVFGETEQLCGLCHIQPRRQLPGRSRCHRLNRIGAHKIISPLAHCPEHFDTS